MDLIKWDPFKDLFPFRTDLNRWFGLPWAANGGREWTPSVDIIEDDKAIRLKVELPEVDKKDVNVEIEQDSLTIRGERKLEKEEKKEHYRRIERCYGAFSRSFYLPEYVDRKAITADYKDGVLTVTLPKTKAPKPEKVAVAVS